MMMELFSFNFIMTEDCNFNCSYCYQKRGTEDLDVFTAKRAIDFFSPLFTQKCHINFSGGEPLLVFDKIIKVVDYIKEKNQKPKKQIKYSITTNGILLDDKILQFLNLNKFSLILSFDGLAQEIFREKGSFNPIVAVLKNIQNYPNINLQTNSVFIPETVGYLSKSIRFILGLDVPNILFSLSIVSRWDSPSIRQLTKELMSLKKTLLEIYKRTGNVPVTNFRQNSMKGGFYCLAGEDRMSLTPDGRLWGCHLFADYSKIKDKTGEYQKYCFGDLDSFTENYDSIYSEFRSNYSELNLTNYYTPDCYCLQCIEFKECGFCPLETVFSGSTIGKIPGYVCEMKKILRKEKKSFWKELEN